MLFLLVKFIKTIKFLELRSVFCCRSVNKFETEALKGNNAGKHKNRLFINPMSEYRQNL